jgi:hypothetical protein
MLRLILLAALFPLPAFAQDFHCRNTAGEIRCGEGACAIETQGFTPMELTRRGNKVSLCAYSGCWEGPVLVRRTRGALTMLFADVRGSTPGNSGSESLAVIHDRAGRVAQVRWGGFANAMTCD